MSKLESTDFPAEDDQVRLDRTILKLQLPDVSGISTWAGSTREANDVDSHIFCDYEAKPVTIDFNHSIEDLPSLEASYDPIEKLDEGGQGEILMALDRALNRQLVVKVLKSNLLSSDEHILRFQEEAQVTAQLDHPSIIPIHSFNTDDSNRPCFTMKYVNGITLGDYLKRISEVYLEKGIQSFDERLSLTNRLECFLKICDAVEYAHSKGIVHRDLKPANIMIGEFHEVYVMDWGAACQMDAPPEDSDSLMGTPGYMDPESVQDPKPSSMIDIFALGVILFEIVSLKRGMLGNTLQERILNMLNGTQPPLKHLIGSQRINLDLGAIIERARSPRRAERYSSVAELADDIRLFLGDQEVSSRPDNWFRKTLRNLRRNIQAVAITTLSVILLLAGVTIYSLHSQNRVIRQAKERELRLAGYQAKVSATAHKLDSHFLHLTHLLTRAGDKTIWSLENPSSGSMPLYSSGDYDTPPLPTGTAYSTACGKPINLDAPVYKLAPNVKYADVKNDLTALFRMQPHLLETQMRSSFGFSTTEAVSIKDRILDHGVPIMWIYVGLENGVFVGFPGKGGYPEDFDPRKRPWYLAAKRDSDAQWGAPYFDINSSKLVLPCTYGLNDSTGAFRGIAALDVTLEYVVTTLMSADDPGAAHIVEKTVLDDRGQILVSSQQRELISTNAFKNDSLRLRPYPDAEVLQQILKKKQGEFTKSVDGTTRLFVFSHIPSLGWYYLEQAHYDKLDLL